MAFERRNLLGFFLGFCVAVLAAVLLVPYLATGYYFDDVANSVLRGYLALNGLTLGDFVRTEMLKWLTGLGRLFPLGSYIYYVWYALPSLAVYRWVQVGLTALDLAVFVGFIRQLGMPKRRAWLTGAIVPLLFQIRNFHDPITSYTFLLQLSFLFGIGAASLLVHYLRSGSRVALALGLVSYLALLLLYEPGFVLIPLIFLAGLAERAGPSPQRKRYAFALFALLTAAYGAAALFVRYYYGSNYSGMHGGLRLWGLWAFVCQSSAALPLIYEFFGKAGLFRIGDLWGAGFVRWQTPVLGLFAAWVFHALLRESAREPSSPPIFLRLGWLLWLLPSLLVALSERYQMEVNRPGLGYLPVYFAYFGVALLAADFVPRWVERGRWPARLSRVESRRQLAAGVFAVLAVFAFNGNRLAARELNHQRMEHRLVIQAALEAGLFAELPENATVLFDETSGWLSPEFVAQYAHRRVTFLYREPGEPIRTLRPSSPAPYYLRAEDHPDGSGWVLLGRVDETREGKGGRLELLSKNARIARLPAKGPATLQSFGSATGSANSPAASSNPIGVPMDMLGSVGDSKG
jgi:hypothetical protein